jgi:hypothetical protein
VQGFASGPLGGPGLLRPRDAAVAKSRLDS